MFDHATTLLAEAPVSPLLLSDHLITLAEQADQAGYQTTARRLVALAYKVLDEPALWLPVPAVGHRQAKKGRDCALAFLPYAP